MGRGKTGLATLAEVRSDVARRDSKKVTKSLFPVSAADGEPRRGRGAEAPGTRDFRASSQIEAVFCRALGLQSEEVSVLDRARESALKLVALAGAEELVVESPEV